MDVSLEGLCPVCAAGVGEECELNNGALRFESHRERLFLAEDVRAGHSILHYVPTLNQLH
jgi:hypothetical protein